MAKSTKIPELTIITQNLDARSCKKKGKKPSENLKILNDIMEKYKKDHKANIYAFQEVGEFKDRNWSYITKTIVAEGIIEVAGDPGCAKKRWDEIFSWSKFRSGYWDERDIKFARKTIKIINFHSSPTYNLAIRYTLLKRLSDLKSFLDEPEGLVVLLGDFNAAFSVQMKDKDEELSENERFLEKIKEYSFIECIAPEESKQPHPTRLGRKLDHIFISESLFKQLQKYKITYIDEVNLNHKSKSKDAFTDHSGIMLTIELPDNKEDTDSEQTEKSAP